jgi:hypothetical protein
MKTTLTSADISAAAAALIVTAVAVLAFGTIMTTFTAISRRAELP